MECWARGKGRKWWRSKTKVGARVVWLCKLSPDDRPVSCTNLMTLFSRMNSSGITSFANRRGIMRRRQLALPLSASYQTIHLSLISSFAVFGFEIHVPTKLELVNLHQRSVFNPISSFTCDTVYKLRLPWFFLSGNVREVAAGCRLMMAFRRWPMELMEISPEAKNGKQTRENNKNIVFKPSIIMVDGWKRGKVSAF